MKKFYYKKKILITGGLGFIGSNLARFLVNNGAIVTIIDNLHKDYGGNLFNISDFKSKVNLKIGDIRNKKVMTDLVKDKHIIFHLASQTSHMGSMNDPINDLEINIIGQIQILELCKQFNPKVKIIYSSTRQLYGIPDYLPVDEKHKIQPVDVNGINKFTAERYLILYSKVYGINYSILRMTNIFGPGIRIKDAKQMFLGIWIKSLIEGKSFKVYGSGDQLRDFLFVDDCIEALLLVGRSDISNKKIYNIGNNKAFSLTELAKLIINLGNGGSFDYIQFPKDRKSIDIGDFFSDYSYIYNDLGWQPKVSIKDGLNTTIKFYKKNYTNYN